MTQAQPQQLVQDNRASVREGVISPGISCFISGPAGPLIEGVVRDISDNGAGVIGETDGLTVGQKVQIVFVVASGQKVRYEGFIKHVENDARHCGVQFVGGPQNLDPSYDPRASPHAHAGRDGAPTCLRCRTPMEVGYIVDHTHVGRGREIVCAPQWARGVPAHGGRPARNSSYYHVQTYRCPDCGVLESRAGIGHA